MPSDNYGCLFVVTMTPGIAYGTLNHKKVVGRVRNMNMGLRTPVLWPMWPVKVSHRVPVEWLGNLHSEKNRCRTLVRGYCGCFGEVKGSKDGGLAWSGY